MRIAQAMAWQIAQSLRLASYSSPSWLGHGKSSQECRWRTPTLPGNLRCRVLRGAPWGRHRVLAGRTWLERFCVETVAQCRPLLRNPVHQVAKTLPACHQEFRHVSGGARLRVEVPAGYAHICIRPDVAAHCRLQDLSGRTRGRHRCRCFSWQGPLQGRQGLQVGSSL